MAIAEPLHDFSAKFAGVGGDPVNSRDPTGLADEIIVRTRRIGCYGRCRDNLVMELRQQAYMSYWQNVGADGYASGFSGDGERGNPSDRTEGPAKLDTEEYQNAVIGNIGWAIRSAGAVAGWSASVTAVLAFSLTGPALLESAHFGKTAAGGLYFAAGVLSVCRGCV